MSQLFFSYQGQTILLRLKNEKEYSIFDLVILGLEKYFIKNNIDFSFSRNPFKLKSINSIFPCSSCKINHKNTTFNKVFKGKDLNEKSLSLIHILCSKQILYSKDEINRIMKLDFNEIY